MDLAACPHCRRHVRVSEAHCPFCHTMVALAAGPVPVPRVRLSRAGLFAFALAAGCRSEPEPAKKDPAPAIASAAPTPTPTPTPTPSEPPDSDIGKLIGTVNAVHSGTGIGAAYGAPAPPAKAKPSK